MAEETLTTAAAELYPDPAMKEMLDAGVFFGRTRTRTNPRMRQFILTNRASVEIINLEKTAELLERAVEFLKEKAKSGANILLVGTQPSAIEAIQKTAADLKLPSVQTRWLGGTLTNFKVILKRLDYFRKLKSDWAAGLMQKYTKKEQVGIERELNKLTNEMGSLEAVTSRPDVLVIIDPKVHATAIREARRLNIPVVAFANTDANPDEAQYLVPGNSRARASINWFMEKVAEAIRAGRREIPPAEEAKTEEKKETNA